MAISLKSSPPTPEDAPKTEKTNAKPSELSLILKQIAKEKGDKVATPSSKIAEITRIPTGVFEFDFATGGGFPRSRYSIVYGPESSGKSNVCYGAVAQAQRLPPPCNKVIWVDLEGTMSPQWAAQFGVDVDELILVRPSYGEEAVDLVDALIRAEDVALLILDSLAVVVSTKEIEQSAEKFDVGTAAILVKRLCNKLVLALSAEEKRGHCPAVVLINQTRMKIGCFDYDSPVWLADGTTMKIGKIVSQKLSVEVLSRADNGELVSRRVIGWANNGDGDLDEWLRITVAGGNTGRRLLKVTKGHTIFTPYGEKLAGELSAGDLVTTEGTRYYTDEQHEVILGSILGDGSLRFEKGSTRGHLRIGHGPDQRKYAEYKASLFDCVVGAGKNPAFDTKRSLEFEQYAGIQKRKGLLHLPQKYVEKLTLRALAIWYMDDGNYGGSHAKWGWGKPSISTKILDVDSLSRLAVRIGLIGAGTPTIQEGQGLVWYGENARVFLQTIAPFIPQCMSYKIKGGIARGGNLNVSKMQPVLTTFSEPIVKIEAGVKTRTKYDLTVEDNHNYLVNGVVVHNTMFGDPETMPGGQTMKFLSSLTVRLYGKNKMDKSISSEMPVYKETKMVIKKAKVAVQKYETEYDMCVFAHEGLQVGETKSWNMVSGYLKDLGLLHKADKGTGWLLLGAHYPTLVVIQGQYESDQDFKLKLQQLVISSTKISGFMVSAQGAAQG